MASSSQDPDLELDVLIIGAGLSGINAGYLLQRELPQHRYAILEARDRIGGTWAFWNYPGFRSDSAMAVFGLTWHPWPHDTAIGDGHLIGSYLEQAAVSQGIDQKIRLRHRVTECSWSTAEQRWTIRAEASDPSGAVVQKEFKARWMISCSGYYNYDKPLPANIPGIENFGGEVVHPQFWDKSVDWAGKRVVIIGSGATAVTLLPSLAKTASHVTMLQRSPSYVASRPLKDNLLISMRRWLPLSWATAVTWWRNILVETLFVFFVQNFPRAGNWLIIKGMTMQLPRGFDVKKHFTPRYNVFEQRLCFCPDGDFFEALHQNADVVTDTIDTVTETGIRTSSGQFLEADMIITATGLLIQFLAGIPIFVDGVPAHENWNERFVWNATMLEGMPNCGAVTGYTTGTWTAGADVKTRMLLKVIKHMDRTGATSVAPYIEPEVRKTLPKKPVFPQSSTYLVSAFNRLPVSAGIGPWRNGVRWIQDALRLLVADVTDGMRYYAPEKKKV
ncbi:FAD/NAD(P)-binding domain-containing protein [Thozetella sp. PMI_491]|nr:FAD/NAD(P)-binding domain-containing protein [Thozetella sp. PMI_491]